MKPCWWHDLTLCWFFMSFHVGFQPNSVALIFNQPWMILRIRSITTCFADLLWIDLLQLDLPFQLIFVSCNSTYMPNIHGRHTSTTSFDIAFPCSYWLVLLLLNHLACHFLMLVRSYLSYYPIVVHEMEWQSPLLAIPLRSRMIESA